MLGALAVVICAMSAELGGRYAPCQQELSAKVESAKLSWRERENPFVESWPGTVSEAL